MTAANKLFAKALAIDLAHIGELASFEQALMPVVAPDASPHAETIWRQEIPLRQLFRVANHSGAIVNLELAVLADPIEDLKAAQERRDRFLRQYTADLTKYHKRHLEYAREHMLGFALSGLAKSSKPGSQQFINTRLWYVPDFQGDTGGRTSSRTTNIYPGIKRVMTEPQLAPTREWEILPRAARLNLTGFQEVMREIAAGGA